MSKNSSMPINLPIRGLNTISPFNLDPDSGFARELTNYSLYNGQLVVRPAVRNYLWSGIASRTIKWFDLSDNMALLDNGDIRDLNGGAPVTSGLSVSGQVTRVKHGSLDIIFLNGSIPRQAATPFAVTNYTFTAPNTGAYASCGCSHKGRLYIATYSYIDYSADGLNTYGPATMAGNFNVSSLMSASNTEVISRMFSVSISPNNSVENVLVIFGDAGTVLVYGGLYPGSSTWSLLGKYKMPAPINQTGFVEIDGDIFVATKEYCYWFQDLFSGNAQTAYENSPTRPIENVYKGCGYGFANTPEGAHCFYEPYLDAIIVQCSEKSGDNNLGLIAEYQNEAVCFVYFRKYKAWSVWFTTPCFYPIIRDGDAIYGASYSSQLVKLTHGVMRDQYNESTEIDIESSWKTPYIPPANGKSYTLKGVRTYFQNNLSAYFEKLRAIYDYSDYNAVLGWYTQSTVTQVNPGSYHQSAYTGVTKSWNNYNPVIGAAGSGGCFSLQFTQKPKAASSSTQSQAISTANVYYQQGDDSF